MLEVLQVFISKKTSNLEWRLVARRCLEKPVLVVRNQRSKMDRTPFQISKFRDRKLG